MSCYEISGDIVDLSLINSKQKNQMLYLLLGKKEEIYCLCASRKSPMYVTRREDNYFPAKTKGSGALHDKLCRHHSLTERELASLGYTPEAIGNSDEEDIFFCLSKPLKKSAEPLDDEAVHFNFGAGRCRPIRNTITELGLLHLLWERGELHGHIPEHGKGSMWPFVRRAAYGVKPKRMRLDFGLSDLLLLPLHQENLEQEKWNFAKFKEAQGKDRFIFFIAKLTPDKVAALLNAETRDFSLKDVFGVNISLYANNAKPLLDSLQVSFGNELAYSQLDNDDLIVFGIAKPGSRSANYAHISSLVAMPVLNGHIPFDSRHEKRFAEMLILQNRRFKKPLRYDAERDMQVHPDFVLLDTIEPNVIEVYGMDTEEYRARKEEKRLIYTNGEYPFPYWEWDVTTHPDLDEWIAERPLPR